MVSVSRCVFVLLFGLSLSVFSARVFAQDVALVLSRSDGVFASFAESFRNNASRQGLNVLDGGVASRLDLDVIARADWVVAGGVAAAEAVLNTSADSPPVLLGLGARSHFVDLRQRYPARRLSALVLDQPAERQLGLIRLLIPDAGTVGALLGPDSRAVDDEYRQESRVASLHWEALQVSASSELARALDRILRDSDVLLALPDSVLSSPAAARTILLTSFKYRRPVIGFSRAYVEAGALAAVVSSPEDNARDCVHWLADRIQDGSVQDEMIWPSSFEVLTNPQVARSLSLELPDAGSLTRQLRLDHKEVAR